VPLEKPLIIPNLLALVIGAEHSGASDQMLKAADKAVFLPMSGFVESMNVSVATALCI
jgi:tRNA (guanosine-2'-O-)-methyltransferase